MAARGVNKVILVGNLGQDPETKFAASGSAITNVSVATSESWKDRQTGQAQERTEWHRVVFFNRLAEIAGEYLHKGSKVYIEGSLRTRKWQDQNGLDRYSTEIVASEMQMLDSRGEGSGMASQGGYGQSAPQQAYAPQAAQGGYAQQPPAPRAATPQNAPAPAPAQQPYQQPAPAPQTAPQPVAPPPAMDSFDDDIPF